MRIPCLQSGGLLPYCGARGALHIGAGPHPHGRRRASTAPRCRRRDRDRAQGIERSSAAGICRLHPAVPTGERGHAAADGRYFDAALEPMGIDLNWSMHRRAATHRCGVCAKGRPSSRFVGTAAAVAVLLGALALRGVLFAFVTDPYLIVAVQTLDGVCAAVLGVALPLVVADVTRGTGRFNLGLGVVGSAVGIGAALSTTLAGYAIDHFGSSVAFFSLAAIAACGLALVWLLLPETRPDAERPRAAA